VAADLYGFGGGEGSFIIAMSLAVRSELTVIGSVLWVLTMMSLLTEMIGNVHRTSW
jgi:hypothetical protein